MARKLLQNGSKMAPWKPLGGLWGARGLRRGFPELSGRLLGRSWRLLGPSRVALGASWGRLGPPKVSPEAPRGSPGGSRRASGRSFWELLCGRACRHAKSKKKLDFHDFLKLFLHAFSAFFFAVAAAPTLERTLENIGFHSEGIANFACRPFSRGTKKTTNFEGNLSKHRPGISSNNEGGERCKKHSNIINKASKMPSKIDPGGLRNPLASQWGAWSLPKRPKTQQNDAKRAPGATQE